MNRKALALVLNGLLVLVVVQAGVVPGRWDKLLAESPGTEVIITLTVGDEIRGAYQDVTAETLVVMVDGARRELPKSGIAKVTTAERRTGPLWNGPVIGAAVGGLSAAIITAADDLKNDDAWIAIPIVAGIGAAIGLGVDAAIQTRITLYKAPGVD